MTEKKDTILQQFDVLKEMYCVESVSLQDAIVGNKYLFSFNYLGLYVFYMGELYKANITKLSNKKKIYKFQFKSSVKVNQFLPTFRGHNFVDRQISFEVNEDATFFELYHLNYLNYVENSK